MKRRAALWITSAAQLAEKVGITRECVTNQLITKCHLSSELFIPTPLRGLARPPWRQRADMGPRLGHNVAEKRRRNLSQPHEHGRVVPIVLCIEEGARVQL